MAKSTPLSAGLVTKKGEATPSIAIREVKTDLNKSPETVSGYYKALTLKLDRPRYEALKTAGVKLDKKSQEILVEALDLWLRQINT